MKTIQANNNHQLDDNSCAASNRSPRFLKLALLAALAGLLLGTRALAVDPPPLIVGDWRLDSTSRTLPPTLNTAVDVGSFSFIGGTGSLVISVNAASTGWSVAKRYVIPMRYNLWGGGTSNTWLKVLPACDSGSTSPNNFDLDINVVNLVMQVRLRVAGTDGAHSGTANISIESTGVDTPTLTTGGGPVTPPTSAQVFQGSVLSQIHGRVGVNVVPSPDAALDIGGGNAHGLRIRPTAAAGHPTTGTWYTGTLIVDSAGALFLCTQTGAPGQWKQVTP